jgi:glycosyltransferase involved in cell wall biosynthesis
VSEPPLSVCFAALNAYPAIDPQVPGAIGGVETRAWMLARALAGAAHYKVDFVLRHTAALRKQEYNSVRLRPVIDRLYRMRESVSTRVEKRGTFPFLRFRSFTPALLWQIPLLAACRPFRSKPDPWRIARVFTTPPADVYCTFGVQSNSATVIASAHSIDKPVVLMLGSDSDLDERYTEQSTFVSPYQDTGRDCWRILRMADVVVCQTTWQQERLKSHFGREGRIIPNPIDVEEWDNHLQRVDASTLPHEIAESDRYLLWVGRAEREHKRPQLFVELARSLPDVPCVVILNPREGDLEDEIRRSAPANLRIVRHVPFPLMPRVFSKAAVLVSTSSLEGFPNVFLQAALSRVPVVSLQVGGEFLSETGIGVACDGDWPRFVEAVRGAWRRPPSADALEQARRTVIARHSLAGVVAQFEQVLKECVPSAR